MQQKQPDEESHRLGKADVKFWLAVALVVTIAYLTAYWLFAPT